MWRGVRWLLAVLALAPACAGEPGAAPDAAAPDAAGFTPSYDGSPIVTDALEYRLTYVDYGEHSFYDAEAIATYVNRSDAPVHFERCSADDETPIHGVVRTPPDSGDTFIGVGWGCGGGVPPGVVEPGASLVVPVWLGSTLSPYANPPITMDMRTGLFRIQFNFVTAEGWPLPEELGQSNPFVLLPPL